MDGTRQPVGDRSRRRRSKGIAYYRGNVGMNDIDLKQGSIEWKLARAGSLGAASVHNALKKLKRGEWSAERRNLLEGLIAERFTGIPWEGYRTHYMAWGTEKEPEARAKYAERMGVEVAEVGIIRHPRIPGAHASPDGLVGDDGLVETKCPATTTHINTLS